MPIRRCASEVLAPPTASTFTCSITKLASYEHSDSWEYDQKPSLEENSGIIADFFGETHFKVKIGQEFEPVSVEYCGVEYCQSCAAGYLKISW